MKYKQSRWEVEYDKFKATNKDELITKMANIQRDQAALKEGSEYGDKKAELAEVKKALSKYERTEKNVAKIENILAFKKELVDRTFKLLEEKEKFNKDNSDITKINEEITKLDEDRKKAVERVVEIEAELKNPDLKDENKERLNTEKQSKLREIQENDMKFSSLSNTKQDKAKAVKEFDINKVDQELLKNEQLLGKCDLIGANLVKGKGMNEINAALSNFKFTPNKDFAAKIKAMKEIQKARENQQQNAQSNDDLFEAVDRGVQQSIRDNDVQQAGNGQRANGGAAIATVSDFDTKHPRLAKIKNFFKKAFNGFKNQPVAGNPERTTGNPERQSPEQPSPTPVTPAKDNADFEYAMKHLNGKDDDKVLSQIAEKGMKGFKDRLKVDKELNKKYQEMKKEAAERYANQYGSRYNEQDGMEDRDEK